MAHRNSACAVGSRVPATTFQPASAAASARPSTAGRRCASSRESVPGAPAGCQSLSGARATKGPAAVSAWSARAIRALPVPRSPTRRTGKPLEPRRASASAGRLATPAPRRAARRSSSRAAARPAPRAARESAAAVNGSRGIGPSARPSDFTTGGLSIAAARSATCSARTPGSSGSTSTSRVVGAAIARSRSAALATTLAGRYSAPTASKAGRRTSSRAVASTSMRRVILRRPR